MRAINMRLDVELLRDSCDLHVHTGPSMFERLLDDFEAAKQASDVGMKAIVLKDHHAGTSHRAYLTKKVVGGVEVFGGLVLNYSVGGLNPFAVDAAIKSGAKIIWMPTIDARNHMAYYGELGQYWEMKLQRGKPEEYKGVSGISIFKDDNELDPRVFTILNLVADADIALATAHLSPHETKRLVKEAKKAGVKKIIVTHVKFEVVDMRIEDQIELANEGAYLEYSYSSISPAWHSTTIEQMAENIKKVGTEHCILSSDLGQIHNPYPVEGLRIFNRLLLEKGLTEKEIEDMARVNTSKLLGFE